MAASGVSRQAVTRREALLWGIGSTLPDDSTARALERVFPLPGLSYLLMECRTRRVIAVRGLDPQRPMCLGSLMKTFAAYAHGSPYPEFVCRGCWKPAGHGRLRLALALAQSCNSYFLQLARELNPARLIGLGIAGPPDESAEAWIGLGSGWRLSAREAASAYCELAASAPREILDGLRLAAKMGTAREIRSDCFAKTGTAPCRHEKKTPGDGYVIALYPAPVPRWALLASLDGEPGSHAARVCGEILRRIG